MVQPEMCIFLLMMSTLILFMVLTKVVFLELLTVECVCCPDNQQQQGGWRMCGGVKGEEGGCKG